MSSQGSQTWLRSPMSSQGSQTWLRSPMSSQGSQTWLRSPISSQGSQTWLRSPMSSQGSQTWLRSPMPERGDPYVLYVGRVWRYQSDGKNPSLKKGQTTNYKMTSNDQQKSSSESAFSVIGAWQYERSQMSRTLFFLFSIKLLNEGVHYHLFKGPVVITSYREEGLYYHPIAEPVVITLDQE